MSRSKPKAASKKKRGAESVVKWDRDAYARARVNSDRRLREVHVLVSNPIEIDLLLPSTYAQKLLEELRIATAGSADFEDVLVFLDLPFQLRLDRTQMEQLMVCLVEGTK